MSTNFPGDLTSGFSEPVPRTVADLIPPEGLSFARGGLIPAGQAFIAPVGVTSVDGLSALAAVTGAGGPWRELGVMTSDGLTVPSEEQQRFDEAVAEEIRMALAGSEITVTGSRPWSAADNGPLDDLRTWMNWSREGDPDPGAPAAPQPDVIEQIDRAIEGLCPCGGAPRPPSEELPYGSRYCSYDCVPNHRGRDTIGPRAAMHWRPDLVTSVDDTGLEPWLPRRQHGQFWVEVFERAGTDMLHVRVDDDCRYVGADLPREPETDFAERYEAKLRALLHELENDRHAVPAGGNLHEQSWAHLHSVLGQRSRAVDYAFLGQRSRAVDYAAAHREHLHWAAPELEAVRPALQQMQRHLAQVRAELAAVGRRIAANLRHMLRGMTPQQPVDPRAETLRRVRAARNSGPQLPQRAPRRIDPRGDR